MAHPGFDWAWPQGPSGLEKPARRLAANPAVMKPRRSRARPLFCALRDVREGGALRFAESRG